MFKLLDIYFIVEISPLPLYISLLLFDIVIGFISSLNNFHLSNFLLFNGLFLLILFFILWIFDLMKSSYKNFTTQILNNLYIGYLLFLLTEVLLFLSFFIALFFYFLAPNLSVGLAFPPKGIEILSPWGSPFLNTVILFISGLTMTISLNFLKSKNKIFAIYSLLITIFLSLIFLFIQFLEYKNLSFSIEDSIFGNIFYSLTGFHGIHVIIGTLFLIYALISINNYTTTNHLGYLASSIYWHFVDYIWILLFFFLYIWTFC